jgi:hypothetical protein
VDRLLDILNELKIFAGAAVVFATIWFYANAQRYTKESEEIQYWPALAHVVVQDGHVVSVDPNADEIED